MAALNEPLLQMVTYFPAGKSRKTTESEDVQVEKNIKTTEVVTRSLFFFFFFFAFASDSN